MIKETAYRKKDPERSWLFKVSIDHYVKDDPVKNNFDFTEFPEICCAIVLPNTDQDEVTVSVMPSYHTDPIRYFEMWLNDKNIIRANMFVKILKPDVTVRRRYEFVDIHPVRMTRPKYGWSQMDNVTFDVTFKYRDIIYLW